MTRVEVYEDGVQVKARSGLSPTQAAVYADEMEAQGFRVLVVRPRTETERAA
jgi:hypothetical protein